MRRLTLIAPLLLISLPWIVPAPASAEFDCDGQRVCVYEHGGRGGCRFGVFAAFDNLKDQRFVDCPDKNVDDKISSFWNPTETIWVILYENPGRKGAGFCIRPGTSGDIPRSFNVKASSIYTLNTEHGPPEGC
jgi:hypothetical protein